jgi:tRNA modification GTPase
MLNAECSDGDTIVAVATPPGPGTVAILRLSGPRAAAAAAEFLEPSGVLDGARPLTVIPAAFRLGGLEVPASVVLFRAPRSFTREDVVEVSLPGSPALAAAALESLLGSEGLRLAGPGEFTFRAFRSGRIDLSQAEGVALLIGAASEAEGRSAERQLRGELRSRVDAVAARIIDALALQEASLDFPEDELSVEREAMGGPIEEALSAIEGLRRDSALRLPDSGALRAVLAGLPGAGKSSLLNAILGRPAAIVGEAGGTTRDPVRGTARGPGGRAVEWIDLAGFAGPLEDAGAPRASGDEGLSGAIARLTRMELETADVVVWVIDGAARESSGPSLRLLGSLGARQKVLAVNKCDLLDPGEASAWVESTGRPVLVSALDGRGIADLVTRVILEGDGPGGGEAPQFLVTARQWAALYRAAKLLAAARESLDRGDGAELIAVDLREALGALERITGREVGEKVLDEIFGQFCVGK